jgi:hypothetical protein
VAGYVKGGGRMTGFFSRAGRGLATGIAALLAACGGDGPASNVSYKAGPQVWDFFLFAAKDGPVLVEVTGELQGGPDAAVGTQVADAMGTAFSEPFVKFTADRAGSAHPDYRMIWVLNPAAGYDMNAACTAPQASAPVTARMLEMRAAFCQSGKLLSAVHGWMKASEARPDNPRWRNLIAQMARQLVSNEGF